MLVINVNILQIHYHLKRHKACKHEGVRYPCDKYEYAATTLTALKQHKQSQHEGEISNIFLCTITPKKFGHAQIMHVPRFNYCIRKESLLQFYMYFLH